MTVELKIEKVVITRDVPVVGMESRATIMEKGDRADVHLIIKGAAGAAIPLEFQIFGYSSLDDAIEKARQAVFAFAGELAKAAEHSPLK
jgi:hypothetical protein